MKLLKKFRTGLLECGWVSRITIRTSLHRTLGRCAYYALSGVILLIPQENILASQYRIEHCLYGCPRGESVSNQLLIRPIYALSFNMVTKSADWVAYKVSADSIGIASSLSRQAITDNFIAETLQESDFLELEAEGLIRSQYVSVVNFAGTPYWNDVNFLSNSVARNRNLNQGAWHGLEWSIRNLVNRETEVFIITGPIYDYEKSLQASPLSVVGRMRVPDAFFKIVVTESGQGTAFLLDQDLPVHVHHCELRVAFEEIERATGLSFFTEQPQFTWEPLDSSLGCR